MSFARRIVTQIQSLVPSQPVSVGAYASYNESITSSHTFQDNQLQADDDLNNTTRISMDRKRGQYVIHVIHQSTEGKE